MTFLAHLTTSRGDLPNLREFHSDGVVRMWDFSPSYCPRWLLRRRLEYAITGWCPPPPYRVLLPARTRSNWYIYFLYCPDGSLTRSQIFTLRRIRDLNFPLLAICAAPLNAAVPGELRACADALIMKGLRGYDFSAYTIAMHHLAEVSPGADVILMNDSVFGPFYDIRPFIVAAKWDLAGFCSSAEIENHIQSFAFIVRSLSLGRIKDFGRIFRRLYCFNSFGAVVHLQETLLARIAFRKLKVGSFWHDASGMTRNLTLDIPLQLLNEGFPFIKRSLLGKHHSKQDISLMREALSCLNHPAYDL